MEATQAATSYAVSSDSGRPWAHEGAWPVAPGVHRIPLPLPSDTLKAVNVYVLETDDGLALIDGGWAVDAAREVLVRSLRRLGAGLPDIRRFLVTHVHRDHYSMAAVLGTEHGAEVALGFREKPTLDLLRAQDPRRSPFIPSLVRAGAGELAAQWEQDHDVVKDTAVWRYPDVWMRGDHPIAVGERTLDAVHTPGHTAGHFVFHDRVAALLFAGDHVLPTITPSIGFTMPPAVNPLGDFMASLTRVRELPDSRLLPAHGPVTHSSHERVDQLLAHHEGRLSKTLQTLDRPRTAYDVAHDLGWTRHERAFEKLNQFNQGLASMETKAHLDLLVARGLVESSTSTTGEVYYQRAGTR